MKTNTILFLLFAFNSICNAQSNNVPKISNLKATINRDLNLIIVNYDVSDAENDPIEIIWQLSDNNGNDYKLTNLLTSPTGDIGYPIPQGINKKITFLASSIPMSILRVRLTALDRKPLNIADLVAKVDSNVLRNRLAAIQGIRHRTAGIAKLAATQDSIRILFNGLQLGIQEQTFPYTTFTGRNIIGNKAGITSSQSVVVDAHYDSVANSPGADDNGSGTVGFLEIASILSPYPSSKSLRFIGFDLEETGLNGSQY
jgi:hypothetical protein